MRNNLDSLTQIVAPSFAVYHRFIYATGCYTVVSCGTYTRKPFIVPQVEVGLKTILCHVALTVLIGVQCPWVNIDIRVELLNRHLVAACQQQFADAGRNDSLSK